MEYLCMVSFTIQMYTVQTNALKNTKIYYGRVYKLSTTSYKTMKACEIFWLGLLLYKQKKIIFLNDL